MPRIPLVGRALRVPRLGAAYSSFALIVNTPIVISSKRQVLSHLSFLRDFY